MPQLAYAEAVKKETIEAIQLMDKGALDQAQSKVAQSRDPLIAKMYYWQLYTKGEGDIDFRRITNFIRQNPEWPKQARLKAVAEKYMPDDWPVKEKLKWFNSYSPQTARGMQLYLDALLSLGKTNEAIRKLSDWWATAPLSEQDQTLFLKTYKPLISREAQLKRLDYLLFSKRYTNARALVPYLDAGYDVLAEARIALAHDKGNVNARIDRVPPALRSEVGLTYERLRWRRSHNLNDRAIEILLNPPPAENITNLEDWWRERHILVRRLMEEKRYEEAYKIASGHQQKEGWTHAQAEWVSGWLALRFIKQPRKALPHFEKLYQRVSTPVSKARAAYWMARACDDLERPDLSAVWYREAARYPSTFYGQKAAERIHKVNQRLPKPHTRDIYVGRGDQLAYRSKEQSIIAGLLHFAGQDQEVAALFRHMTSLVRDEKEYKLLADYASSMGRKHDALTIAKEAIKKGYVIDEAYPVAEDWIKTSVFKDRALIYGLIRQESLFNPKAISPAGAYGLMQLMPSTARAVAKTKNIPYKKEKLTNDPSYNVRIGSAYISQLVKRYNGSYPLALAAYNAGPSRVDQWLKTFFDPRINPTPEKTIDFIESIPIYETRNYVQRVLESYDVYRKKIQ